MNLLDLIYNDDSINKLNNREGRLVINNTLACSYLVSGVFLKKQKNILLLIQLIGKILVEIDI